ncbi:hypothetical protein GCM10027347_50320 [Larkinella harenae]
MANPKQTIEAIYGVFSDNNISRLLPMLDENMVLYHSSYESTSIEFHGISGFLSIMSGLYTICENLSVNSLVYFRPDNDELQGSIITTGYFEGILTIDKKPAVLPFMHFWQVKAERVTELRAFCWDSAELQHRLGPDFRARTG